MDFSSGSSSDTDRYGWYSETSKKLHTGVGDFFIENDNKVADLKYIYAGKQLPPEQISEADLVNIMSQDDSIFTRQTRPIQYYYAFEKSMYQAITDEMLNIFATVTDFNNLIGDPVNRYRQEYKSMQKLRALFFERVGEGADLDKFVDFYKWIDDSLNKFLEQLIPASANFSDRIRNMVESHVLERNKYWTKFPTLEMMQEDPEAALRGVNEVSYDWKHGHAPIPMVGSDNKNCLWQDVKRVPENANRTKIYQAKKSIFDRKLSTPYKLDQSVVDSETLSFRNRNTGFIKSTLKIGGSEELKIKQSNIVQEIDCIDFDDLKTKNKAGFSLERTGEETGSTSPKGDIAAPFSLYVDEDGKLTTSIGNYGLKNYHNDSYNQGFGDFSAPMQSPFTEKFVGGNQHRHAELFEAPATRPEPWKLVTSSDEVKIVTQDLNSPRAIYYRDFVAKRPVNIKNIKTNSLGNYTKDFEIVHTMGRYENNAHFVKSDGFDLTTDYISSSFPGSPLSDVEKIIRGRTEHVFVNRFSAPGDPSTMGDSDGGWGLDRYSGEYSPNNDLNFRNLDVRSVNNGILSSHVNQFGYFSGINVKEAAGSSTNALDYSGVGSPYQVNRNAEYHPTSNVPGSSCGTKYDNYYVQHNIPRNDYRYAWITASTISDQCLTASADMQFVSASDAISAKDLTGGNPRYFAFSKNSPPLLSLLPNSQRFTDFAGTNFNITDLLTPETALLGYPPASGASSYVLNHGHIFGITPENPTWGLQDGNSFILNSLLLHRQGPYGWPSWKQIRGDQNPLTRYYRASNTITINPPNKDYLTTINAGTTAVQSDLLPLERYQETPVLSKYKDLTLEIIVATYGDAGRTTNNIRLSLPYGNNLSSFSNARLVQLTNLIKNTKQSFDTLKEYYIGDSIDLDANPIDAFVSLKYPEIVYPAEANWATGKIRSRTQFECKFWKDSRTDRNLVNSSTNSQNIQSGTLVLDSASFGGVGTDDDITYLTCFSQSMWPLDARMNFETADTAYDWVTTVGTSSNNTCGNVGAFYPHYHGGEGELQSPAPQLHGQMEVAITNGSATVNRPLFSGLQYARRQTLPMSASTMAFSGYGRGLDILGGSQSSTTNPHIPNSTISDIFGGDVKWEAGAQSGKNPFYYKDYNHYLEDMKSKAHGYSILPEFRISEHMERYLQKDNFLSTGSGLFTITGSDIETSGEEDFYKVYSHSDFMKHFEVLDSDHKSSEITLKCKALIKFIPYDGFYPVNRCVQLGTLFSQSYAAHVSNYKDLSDYIEDGSAVEATGTAQMDNTRENVWNTYLQPFMKPGILFNTIKSGIAVDYPIFTGSFNTVEISDEELGIDTSAYQGTYISELFFHKRIPFEALISPEEYIKSIPVVNMEPHSSASTSTIARWDGQGSNLYKYAMNNFLAEVPEFFLKGKNMTTFVSIPESEFSSDISGTYSALVRLRKSVIDDTEAYLKDWTVTGYTKTPTAVGTHGFSEGSEIQNPISFSPETITMYSRPTAFGPPSMGLLSSASSVLDLDQGSHGPQKAVTNGGSNNGYNMPFTPSYYDGSSWAILKFQAETEKKYTLDEIFQNMEIDYVRALTGERFESLQNFSQNVPNFFNTLAWQSTGASFECGDLGSNEAIFNFLSGTSTIFGQTAIASGPQAGGINIFNHIEEEICPESVNIINKNAMQVSASVNLKNIARIPPTVYNAISGKAETIDTDSNKNVNVWVIQPKFETPILNFKNSDQTLPEHGSESCAKGMWHQYGRLPSEDEGIYLDLIDVPEELYHTFGIAKPKSLIDLVGFKPSTTTKLGQVAESKQISEAVVAVPFIIKNNQKKFFKLPSITTKRYITENKNNALTANNSVSEMVRKMSKYVFPPTMDFYTNEEIAPFAMYIFEFSHTLDQQDLADIWQNLPPEIGTKFEEQEASISHPLLSSQIKLLSSTRLKQGKVRWMVFKVKKRAKKDYFSKVYGTNTEESQSKYKTQDSAPGLRDKNIVSKNNIPDYSYNWPYDFFSLVELAQIEEEITFVEKPPTSSPTSEKEALAEDPTVKGEK